MRRFRHRYTTTVTLTPGVQFQSKLHQVSGNSMYDPEGVSGHQPYGFDEMVNLFNNYLVLGSRCTVTALGAAASTQGEGTIMLMPALDGYEYVDSEDMRLIVESGHARYMHLTGGYTGTRATSLSSYAKVQEITGLMVFNDWEDAIGSKTTPPTNEWFWNIYWASPHTTPGSRVLIVTVEYDCLWFNPIPLAQS